MTSSQRIEALTSALKTTRRLLFETRAEMLDSFCCHDDDGTPIRNTMDDDEAQIVRRFDRAIAKANQALRE